MGGPPCQPFSLAGVHAGASDDRNMFPAIVDAVRTLRPKVAVFENVLGIIRPSFRPYYDYVCDAIRYIDSGAGLGSRTWDEEHTRLQRHSRRRHPDYQVYVEVVNAADHGAPQVRRRVFLLAIRSDVSGAATWPGLSVTHSEAALAAAMTNGDYWIEHGMEPREAVVVAAGKRLAALSRDRDIDARLSRWRTVRDGLAGLPTPVDRHGTPGVRNHVGIPGARTYPGHTGSDIDAPSKTMKAGVHGVCGGEAMIRFPDGSLRYMTIREAARMQTFPDDYDLPLARSSSMWTIGNAVAVAAARAVGGQLRAHTGI